jgi:hypothetical protein
VTLTPGERTLDELLAEMGTGLLITSMIGSSINATTGDYSRGASGFWVENGAITYPVNECTVAGNLRDMLRTITPANDARPHLSRVSRRSAWKASRLPGPEAGARGGPRPSDRCGPDGGGDRAQPFPADPEIWTKSDDSPVTEADIAIDRVLRTDLLAARPDYGWLSEETEDDAARLQARASSSSIRSTGPAPSSRADELCPFARRGRGWRGDGGCRLPAHADKLYAAARGKGASLNAEPIRCRPRPMCRRHGRLSRGPMSTPVTGRAACRR